MLLRCEPGLRRTCSARVRLSHLTSILDGAPFLFVLDLFIFPFAFCSPLLGVVGCVVFFAPFFLLSLSLCLFLVRFRLFALCVLLFACCVCVFFVCFCFACVCVFLCVCVCCLFRFCFPRAVVDVRLCVCPICVRCSRVFRAGLKARLHL